MKELKLIDRVVVEIKSEGEPCPTDIANQLRLIALEIEEGCSGRSRSYQNGCECLWEHETPEYGGFRMGNRSLISDAYYGTKEFFPVSCVTREDIDSKGFDASNIDDDTMEGIASQMDIYACEGVGYWEALEGACKDYEIPRKED